MRIFLNKKGQNTLEYAIIIALVVAALISMQGYIKRGLQGKLRQSTDDIGDQFSPAVTTGATNTTLDALSHEVILGGASPTTNTDTQQNQERNSNENTGDFGELVPGTH